MPSSVPNPPAAAMKSLPRRALVALAGLRARLRAGELGLVALAVGVGVLAGLCVSAMTSIVNIAHVLIYGIPFDVRLSAAERVSPIAAFVAPMLAGLALGSVDAWRARKKLPPAVDPVEANALRGGRMSLRRKRPRRGADGRRRTVAAHRSDWRRAMRRSAPASLRGWGLDLRLRRQDLRMLVGCGAGRRDRGGVRRAVDRRFLRLRAHHRRLFARQRRTGLRRLARRGADHQGDHRRALCHQRAGASAR